MIVVPSQEFPVLGMMCFWSVERSTYWNCPFSLLRTTEYIGIYSSSRPGRGPHRTSKGLQASGDIVIIPARAARGSGGAWYSHSRSPVDLGAAPQLEAFLELWRRRAAVSRAALGSRFPRRGAKPGTDTFDHGARGREGSSGIMYGRPLPSAREKLVFPWHSYYIQVGLLDSGKRPFYLF